MLMDKRANEQGFSLPAMVVLSLVVLAFALVMLQSASSMLTVGQSRYYQRMTELAAEAGVERATDCLAANQHTQTWGNTAATYLTESSDCFGAVQSSYPAYVYSDTKLRTYYTVGNLDATGPDSVQISATGKTELLAGGTVQKTYTSIIKKTIAWALDLNAQATASGNGRTCGILSGNVWCWGRNEYGQLGNGTDGGGTVPTPPDYNMTNSSLVPVKVIRQPYPAGMGGYRATDIDAGTFFNCTIIDKNNNPASPMGEVYCWGQNTDSEMGNPALTADYYNVPQKVSLPAGKNFTSVMAGRASACALSANGDLYCWGANAVGQVGNGSTATQATPVLVAGPNATTGGLAGIPVMNLSTSGSFNDHFCVVAGTAPTNGKAYCWGSQRQGELGQGNNTAIGSSDPYYLTTPTLVNKGAMAGLIISAISVEGRSNNQDRVGPKNGIDSKATAHSCAIGYVSSSLNSKAVCWGSNLNGYLGLGASGVMGLGSNYFPAWIYSTPQNVDATGLLNNKTVTEIATSDMGSCVIAYPVGGNANTSQAYCWGLAGARGDGNTTRAVSPVLVVDQYTPSIFGSNKVHNLIGGGQRFCALANGKSYCWGNNIVGQIGDGTQSDASATPIPYMVAQPTEAKFLSPTGNQYIY